MPSKTFISLAVAVTPSSILSSAAVDVTAVEPIVIPEVSFSPESNILLIRSESRVGESDLGVNQKRVDLLKSKMF